jgi:hypothetical protein
MFHIYSGNGGPYNRVNWKLWDFQLMGKNGNRPSFPPHPPAFISAATSLPAHSEATFLTIMCVLALHTRRSARVKRLCAGGSAGVKIPMLGPV